MSLENVGAIEFSLRHPHPAWQSNAYRYKFGPFHDHGIYVAAVKSPDRTLEVVVSGPFSKTTVFKKQLPDIIQHDHVHVVISWESKVLTFYLNGSEAGKSEVQALQSTVFPITISSGDAIVPIDKAASLFQNLGHVFNTISAFLDAPDPTALRSILEFGLDLAKFGTADVESGSLKAKLTGVKKVLDYFRQHFGSFLAVFTARADRLAEAHVAQKEAETKISEEHAKQEKLQTLEQALKIVFQIGQHLADGRSDLDPDEKQELLQPHLLNPMEQIANILIDNRMTLTIDDLN